MSSPLGVVLVNLGGPRDRQEIRPFLEDLFSDPAIIPFPPSIRHPLARLISSRRAPKVAPHYQQIGGGSPLVAETERQAELLETVLKERGENARVVIGMRYGKPSLSEAAQKLFKISPRGIVLCPLFPYTSSVTTGSAEVAFHREAAAVWDTPPPVTVTGSWAHLPAYSELVATVLRESLLPFPEPDRGQVPVVAVAHAIPMRLVKRGDPYTGELGKTVSFLKGRFTNPIFMAYQSRVGPVKWTGPSLPHLLTRMVRKEGITEAVILPLGFVADHLETLWELDIQVRGIALQKGFVHLVRAPVFNHRPEFISFLADVVTGVETGGESPGND